MRVARLTDVGPIRPIKNPGRREYCRCRLEAFMRTYFPRMVRDSSHFDLLKWFEEPIHRGGNYGTRAHRGSGTTTRVMLSAIFATLYGHRGFTLILCQDRDHALTMMRNIVVALSENSILAEDFPEVCQLLEDIGGLRQRCGLQSVDGERTNIRMEPDAFVFPTLADSPASGAKIQTRSVTAGLIGLSHRIGDRALRPDLVMLDNAISTRVRASVSRYKRVWEDLNKFQDWGFRTIPRFAWIDNRSD